MKIQEKVREELNKRNLNLKQFSAIISGKFGADKYRTLIRFMNEQTKVRESTLFEIATGFGMSVYDLKEGTNIEEKIRIFSYSEKAYFEIFDNETNYLFAKLVLKPEGRTPIDYDIADSLPNKKITKRIYGLTGETTCVIITNTEVNTHVIKRNETISFDSTNKHYFENKTNSLAECIYIQDPRIM